MTKIITDRAIKLPEIRDDIVISEGPKEPDGSPTWTIHDPISNHYYRIGWEAFEILSLFPFVDDAHHILGHINRNTPLTIDLSDIQDLIKFLIDNQLVKSQSVQHIEHLKKQHEKQKGSLLKTILHSYIFFKIKLFNPNDFLEITLPIVRIFYTKIFFLCALILLAVSLFLTLRRIDEFLNTFEHFFNWEGFVLYVVSLAIVKMIHEFGHAYAAKRNGLDVTDLGIAFIVLYPILYTDTTDSWKMQDIKKRRDIGIAGIGAEFYLAIISLFLWHILPEGSLKSMTFIISSVSFTLSLLINLNPLMRLDGYYLFSDYIGIENLQERSFELAKRKMRRWLWGWSFQSPERTITSNMERFLIKFAFATWAYRFMLFLGIALLVYNIFPKPFGFILMSIELGFFIAWPIMKEITIWCKGANPMRIKFNALLTTAIIGGLIYAFVHPWHNTMSLPALIQNSEYQKVIAPHDARVHEIFVRNGQPVREGDTIIVLTSADLEKSIQKTSIDLQNTQARLEAIARDKTLIKDRAVLLEEQKKLLQENKNKKTILDSLTIYAKKSGQVRDVNKSLHEGRWVSQGTSLMTIVEKPSIENTLIHAYATEKQLPLLHNGSHGYFYDDFNAYNKIEVQLISISRVSQSNMPWKELSSKYGGSVAVDTEQQEDNITHEPLYHLTLHAIKPKDIQQIDNQIRGHVTLKVKEESFSSQLFRTTVALFNREFSL